MSNKISILKYYWDLWQIFAMVHITTFLFALTPPAHAIDISVEPLSPEIAEQTTIQVDIYANNATTLISMGAKISFDPNVLSVISTTKNQDPFNGFILDRDGDPSTTSDQYSSPAVEVDNTNGSVTMLGGRMTGTSTTGLFDKVLLGSIIFQGTQIGSSNISVDLAKYHPAHPAKTFDNFVNLNGSVDEPTNLGNLTLITVLSDQDLDTLPDSHETSIYGTDPLLADTDGDGIDDGEELAALNSMDCSSIDCADCWNCDIDGDGQANNLLDEDADGDSHNDGVELAAQSNPLNNLSYPLTTEIQLQKGFNLVAIPADPFCRSNLKEWLAVIGDDSEIDKVMAFDGGAGTFITLFPGSTTNPDFTLYGGESLFVYAKKSKTVTFTNVLCRPYAFPSGTNFIGNSCPQDGHSAFDVLTVHGPAVVSSIQRFNHDSGKFETAGFENGIPVGVDFPIISGEGYFIFVK